MCLNTWVREVQDSAFVLGKIETKNVASPRARSRSVLQANLFALEIKALSKDANVDVIIANTPKGEQNRNPTKNQLSIECPSYGLSSCTKTFCVAKKWWDIRPKNNDRTSNLLSVHWSIHFKGLYNLEEDTACDNEYGGQSPKKCLLPSSAQAWWGYFTILQLPRQEQGI